jgi:hypothetical protein
MNDIVLNRPIFKNKSYICFSKNEIIIDIYDENIVDLYKITNKSNAIKLSVNINNEELKEKINHIDDIIFGILKKKYKKWFNNEDINLDEYYEKSICEQTNRIEILLSNDGIIIYNNEKIELNRNLYDILKNKKNLIKIKLKYLGLYVYKQKIENKWIIKEIEINDKYNEDEFIITNNEIISEWENTLNDTIFGLNELVKDYNNKLDIIHKFKENNINLINDIKKNKNTNNIFFNKINLLKNNIKNILSINDNR